jgi:hypothetical protein
VAVPRYTVVVKMMFGIVPISVSSGMWCYPGILYPLCAQPIYLTFANRQMSLHRMSHLSPVVAGAYLGTYASSWSCLYCVYRLRRFSFGLGDRTRTYP